MVHPNVWATSTLIVDSLSLYVYGYKCLREKRRRREPLELYEDSLLAFLGLSAIVGMPKYENVGLEL